MIRKVVINIFSVLLLLVLLDFFVGKILEKFYFKAVSGVNYHLTQIINETKADVLIIGSSEARNNYIPSVFNDSLRLSAYNGGKNQSVLLLQNALLKSALKRYTPKIIILDYSGGYTQEQNSFEMLSSLAPYWDSNTEIREIIKLKGKYEKFKMLSKLYRYNSQLYKIFRNTKYSKKRETDNGYMALHGFWNKKMDTLNEVRYEQDSIVLNANKKFIKMAKESGAFFVVISSPVYMKFKYREDLNLIKKMCEEENVRYWNFSQDSLFLNNRKYFNDPEHLNYEGAKIFTKLIVSKLESFGF